MAKRSLKRKLNQEFEPDCSVNDDVDVKVLKIEPNDSSFDLMNKIRSQVDVLRSTYSFSESDRLSARNSANQIAQLASDEDIVSLIIDCGAVPALIKHLEEPPPLKEGCDGGLKPYEHEVERECAAALGLLSIAYEHQQHIVDCGALTHLVDLLKRRETGCSSKPLSGVIRRAADAITNLAHENKNIKSRVRIEGGIEALVELLQFADSKVQRASAGALRTLAFRHDENKRKIIECNALPSLVLLLQCDDPSIHSEAVGVIGNLVHSSPDIKKEVILSGVIQPVIRLLSSSCSESQSEAALLLGQFSSADSDCKAHICQRGAVPPLVKMLNSSDPQLKEMSAFALGRLAQETHNQAGIACCGAIAPLVELLDGETVSLQHNAAFALFGLAHNEDNIADFIKAGAIKKLQDGKFIALQTRDCVAKTLKKLEENCHGQVLNHLLNLMRGADKAVKQQVALALAHLCAPDDRKNIFLDNNGLELLLEPFDHKNVKKQRDFSVALYSLATKGAPITLVDHAPLSPNPQVYWGEQYVNNPKLSDVTFIVEGKQFYAHRTCLLASSDAFRAMFHGGYRERDAKDVEIPNIRWEVFELMMRFIYTGSVTVNIDIAEDLLRAADQYLLDNLKSLCENAISQGICADNISILYEFSNAFSAVSLRKACILFVLEQFDKLSMKPWYHRLLRSIIPDIRSFFVKELSKHIQA